MKQCDNHHNQLGDLGLGTVMFQIANDGPKCYPHLGFLVRAMTLTAMASYCKIAKKTLSNWLYHSSSSGSACGQFLCMISVLDGFVALHLVSDAFDASCLNIDRHNTIAFDVSRGLAFRRSKSWMILKARS
jgi:hypothetical protein